MIASVSRCVVFLLGQLLLSQGLSHAQPLLSLKTGVFKLNPVHEISRQAVTTQYLFFKPGHILTSPERSALSANGLKIVYALKDTIYWVRIEKPQTATIARQLFDIDPVYKIGASTAERNITNRFRLSVAPGLSHQEIASWFQKTQITILDTVALRYGIMDVEVPAHVMDEMIRTPWISFIQDIPVDEEINYRALHAERGWGLVSPLARGLDGSGMTVGIGDGGRLEVHEDLSREYLDLASFGTSTHATQVSGIITGAGLIDPFYGSGYAPKAHILLRNYSDILWTAPDYIADYGLSLTNNSYGSSLSDCNYIGDYNGVSMALDVMAKDHPELLHVFAAGNSGGMTCSPFPVRYATVAGGYQTAKNVLTAGAITNADANAGFSSRGPVDDGRLKPEIVAYGQTRFTTIGTNQYASNSGTSFSSPATTGVATLLYQRYKQLHADSLPEAALIKNVLCNGADDLGIAGPDYTFGYGRINGERSVSILEDGQYTSFFVDHAEIVTHAFSIPAGTGAADIMLNWSDEPSAPYETVTLVNDLDLTIVTPSGDTLKPWVLNCTPSGVAQGAIPGYDRFNNLEQVTMSNPVEGNYTIVIKGYKVALGPQPAWVSWDIQPAGVTVQSPIGGEAWKPGNPAVANDRQYIRWDAFGTGTSTFQVEYSTNGGTNWTNLNNSVSASQRWLDWFPPAIPTDQLKVRVTASNGMTDTSDLNSVIMSPPTNVVATSPCNGYVQLSWSAVTGASFYRIFMVKNESLTEIDTTSLTSIILRDFPADSAIWVTVAGAFASGATGLRARAVMVTANGGHACTWDHDIRLDSLIDLRSGRRGTSTALTNNEVISIRLTNLGMMNATGFDLSYQVNDGTIETETFPGTVNAATSQTFSFSTPHDFASAGTYTIKVWITYGSDGFPENDTLMVTIRQINNLPWTLPWFENFETVPDTMLISNMIGLPQLEKCDASLASGARVRTFSGDIFCHSGQRALTLDAIRTGSSKNGDITFTINLAAYDVATHDIRLSFQAMHHEIIPDVTNTEAVWVRGNDALPFLLVTYIPNEAVTRGVWQKFSGLEISKTLQDAGQTYSPSFQIRFSHGVYATAGQVNSQDGQTIDDIALDLITKDLKLLAIDHPTGVSCDLGEESITVQMKNTTALDVGNASVYYRVNGGTIYSTFVGNVTAGDTMEVVLQPDFDFTMPGLYAIETWVTSTEDEFHSNDTLRIEVLHTPAVTAFPYREGFENTTGGWIATGTNSTWAHGIPGKQTFSRAAEGSYVWTTSLTGGHNPDETSYLYSPCFDLAGMTQPWLSFAFQYQLETGYDYAWVEYKVAGSTTWVKLGTQGSGTNWYNHVSNAWNGSQNKWISTGSAIPFTDTTIQFRWVMQSDVGVEFEGLCLDQVHVYDRVPVYTGGNVQIIQPVSGNDWVHLQSAGQRIFSIHPMGQDLGDVTLGVYTSGSSFLLSDSLYLLSRNWVLSSSMAPVDTVRMRGYFTTTQATNLVNATGCSQCISARDGFDFATLRYTGSNQDGDYSNNTAAAVTTYTPDSTHVLPYDNGYYAEWNAPGMSEWWITSQVTKYSGALDKRISSSNDDAEEHEFSGAVNPYRSSLALTERDGEQYVGWRFRQITIPKNSYIESAHIEWTAADTGSLPANWILQAELSANAASFSPSKYNISQRARSPQVVQWSPGAWNVVNGVYISPDIRHLVQQVVDQSAWVTGRDLVFVLRGDGWREAWSYDGDADLGARLVIEYDDVCVGSGICYVDKNASGQQDGSSWTDAYRSLEQALDLVAHCPDIDEIWMADGTYSLFSEVARTSSYAIRSGVRIYGGFQGNETAVNQRIPGAFPTILSGEIGSPGVMTDNLYHVVTIQPGVEETLLDGITIKNGMANGMSADQQRGSGIYNLGKVKTNQVVIENCVVLPVYNGAGSEMKAEAMLQVKQ